MAKLGSEKPRTSAARLLKKSVRPPSDVPFFIAAVVFLVFALGSVVVAQKIAISYLVREFPRVAEANYRAMQANLAAVEQRLDGKLNAIRAACRTAPAGLPPPPSDLERLAP